MEIHPKGDFGNFVVFGDAPFLIKKLTSVYLQIWEYKGASVVHLSPVHICTYEEKVNNHLLSSN